VKKVNVIRDYTKLTKSSTNYLIPLEFICRYYIAGSLFDRLKAKELKPELLGFAQSYKPKYGDKLPEPFFEVTTKLEKTDRLLTFEEAIKISGLSKEDYKALKEIFLRIDEKMNEEVRKNGLIHVDGKKEFAFDDKRELMIVDTFGTADEDRFWDAKEYEAGNFIELSKELVRQYYRSIGYYDSLVTARKRNLPEPSIPSLPSEYIERTSKLYIELYEKLTGEKFSI
jgi:phosphoribosylaminoimidazole-succinocarboxamide synthase